MISSTWDLYISIVQSGRSFLTPTTTGSITRDGPDRSATSIHRHTVLPVRTHPQQYPMRNFGLGVSQVTQSVSAPSLQRVPQQHETNSQRTFFEGNLRRPQGQIVVAHTRCAISKPLCYYISINPIKAHSVLSNLRCSVKMIVLTKRLGDCQ